MTLQDFWLNQGGEAGDFSYGTTHLVSMAILLVLTAVLCILGRDNRRQRGIVVTFACVQLAFEAAWRIIWMTRSAAAAELYPFYPCNLNGILVPIAALVNRPTFKKITYFFAFIGAVLTFAMPQGIFCNRYLNLSILKSIVQHAAIFILPVVEFAFGSFRPKFRDIGWVFLGVIVCLVNAEVMPLLFGQRNFDYMFFRSGLPFVIEGVPQWLTFGVFGSVVIALLAFLADVKGAVALFGRRAKKQPDAD